MKGGGKRRKKDWDGKSVAAVGFPNLFQLKIGFVVRTYFPESFYSPFLQFQTSPSLTREANAKKQSSSVSSSSCNGYTNGHVGRKDAESKGEREGIVECTYYSRVLQYSTVDLRYL